LEGLGTCPSIRPSTLPTRLDEVCPQGGHAEKVQ
jgi:hypothetical protein